MSAYLHLLANKHTHDGTVVTVINFTSLGKIFEKNYSARVPLTTVNKLKNEFYLVLVKILVRISLKYYHLKIFTQISLFQSA